MARKSQKYIAGNYITSHKVVPTCSKTTKLSSAIAKVQSGHDPIFIYDNKKFIGIIAVHALPNLSKFDMNSDVFSNIMIPFNIKKETSIFEVITFMYGSQIYTLPVFDKNKNIIGIVKAEEILKKSLDDDQIFNPLIENIRIAKITTLDYQSTVNQVLKKMNKHKTSRIVLVNDKGRIKGIITRYDLREAYLKPSPRQRFMKKTASSYHMLFVEDETRRHEYPARNFASERVVSASNKKKMRDIVIDLIKSKKSSTVIVDEKKPVGILSTRDLLVALSKTKPETEIPIKINKPSLNVTNYEIAYILDIIKQTGFKIHRRTPIKQIEITFEEPKTSHHDTIVFNSTIILKFIKGKSLIAKSKQINFIQSVRELIKKISKQHRRHYS
jgi:predicted transcriptional regulator